MTEPVESDSFKQFERELITAEQNRSIAAQTKSRKDSNETSLNGSAVQGGSERIEDPSDHESPIQQAAMKFEKAWYSVPLEYQQDRVSCEAP